MKSLSIKTLLATVSICLTFFMQAQVPYSGTFKGRTTVLNMSSDITLILRNDNGIVTGVYMENDGVDVKYGVSGNLVNGVLKAWMVHVSAPILQFRITIAQTGNSVKFSLDNRNWATLIPDVILQKVNQPNPTNDSESSGYTQSQTSTGNLVGTWTNTKTYGSGEFRNITVQKMVITPSRQLVAYKPISYNSLSGSYINDTNWEIIGRFEVEITDKSIYVVVPGEGKTLIGTYTLRDDTMLTIAPDGEKELWKKS